MGKIFLFSVLCFCMVSGPAAPRMLSAESGIVFDSAKGMVTGQLNMGNYAIWSSSAVTAARYQINGSTVVAILPGSDSLGIGVGAGRLNTANNNAFVGMGAGQANTTGTGNAFVGMNAGWTNTTGADNAFFGVYAGNANTASSNNSFFGAWAGRANTTGANNSAVGYNAGFRNDTGSANTIFGSGAGAGFNAATISFSSSAIVGYQAGYNLLGGANDNIFLGFMAGYSVTTGTGNIIIGYNKNAPLATTNNHLNIGGLIYGDLASGNVGISSAAPTGAKLVIQNAGDGKPALQLITTGSKPTCAAGYRGGFFVEQGGAGVTDKIYLCMKMSTDAYQWVLLASGN